MPNIIQFRLYLTKLLQKKTVPLFYGSQCIMNKQLVLPISYLKRMSWPESKAILQIYEQKNIKSKALTTASASTIAISPTDTPPLVLSALFNKSPSASENSVISVRRNVMITIF